MTNKHRVQIELWNVIVPLAAVMEASAGPRKRTAHVLMVFVKDSQYRGAGYSIFRERSALDQATRAAQEFLNALEHELPALLRIERLEPPRQTNDMHARNSAANALSLAAWDLAAQQRGCACADLWGRPSGRSAMECYASALWQEQSIADLIAEAKHYRDHNYKYVKMRVGHSLADNLERIAAVRSVYSLPGTIAIEAAGAEWNVADVNEFLRSAVAPYMWTEDPVPHEVIGGLSHASGQLIVAGEKCSSISELVALFEDGKVHSLILDVQCLGGPLRFLEAARVLSALGATIGSHRFPYYSSHLLASFPRSLPLETIDWANPALEPFHMPDNEGRIPVRGPGFGIRIKQSVFDRYASRIS